MQRLGALARLCMICTLDEQGVKDRLRTVGLAFMHTMERPLQQWRT
jgi:hypothetical protein